jgi:hypothetical protein
LRQHPQPADRFVLFLPRVCTEYSTDNAQEFTQSYSLACSYSHGDDDGGGDDDDDDDDDGDDDGGCATPDAQPHWPIGFLGGATFCFQTKRQAGHTMYTYKRTRVVALGGWRIYMLHMHAHVRTCSGHARLRDFIYTNRAGCERHWKCPGAGYKK